jgi:hypothetical protein
MTNQPSDPLPSGPTPDQIKRLHKAISTTYAPALNMAEADECLKPVDFFELVNQYGEFSRSDMMELIDELGFVLRNIDGDTYIPVKYTTQ